jgi:hypothetical protein
MGVRRPAERIQRRMTDLADAQVPALALALALALAAALGVGSDMGSEGRRTRAWRRWPLRLAYVGGGGICARSVMPVNDLPLRWARYHRR